MTRKWPEETVEKKLQTCAVCGREFVPYRAWQKYCSPPCERPCAWCGKPFTPKPGAQRKQRYCSLSCSSHEKTRNPYRGESHYAWKGDAASPTTKRERARALYSIDGKTCEHHDCFDPAVDRHHVNGDTGDNRRENIAFLCRRHHMTVDGRLERFVEAKGGRHGS